MVFNEWYYLVIAAMVSSYFIFVWQKKRRHIKVSGKGPWCLIFFGSLFNAWVLDVLQRQLGVITLSQMMQVVLGCWFFILVSTTAKHYALNGWSKKIFWLDHVEDLISFTLMGLVVYLLS
jgi:hypothetical protein